MYSTESKFFLNFLTQHNCIKDCLKCIWQNFFISLIKSAYCSCVWKSKNNPNQFFFPTFEACEIMEFHFLWGTIPHKLGDSLRNRRVMTSIQYPYLLSIFIPESFHCEYSTFPVVFPHTRKTSSEEQRNDTIAPLISQSPILYCIVSQLEWKFDLFKGFFFSFFDFHPRTTWTEIWSSKWKILAYTLYSATSLSVATQETFFYKLATNTKRHVFNDSLLRH